MLGDFRLQNAKLERKSVFKGNQLGRNKIITIIPVTYMQKDFWIQS